MLLVLLLAVSAGQTCNSPVSSDRRSDKSKLVLGTFNLAWCFDGVSDPSGSPWTSTTAPQHIQKVAEQILRAGVDVLAVHELENCGVLTTFLGYLGSSYRGFLIPGTDTGTRQNCALVSKIDPEGPLTRTEARVSYPVSGSTCTGSATPSDSGVSKHGIATIKASTFTFDFVFAHFKSGGLASDCMQREAQASVLASNAVRSGVATVLAGDFNDWDTAFTDADGNTGTSQTVPILKGSRFVNAGQRLPLSNRSTSGVGLIDHILLTSELNSRVIRVTVDGSGYPTTSTDRIAALLSDHLPLTVTLTDAAASLSAQLLLCAALIVAFVAV